MAAAGLLLARRPALRRAGAGSSGRSAFAVRSCKAATRPFARWCAPSCRRCRATFASRCSADAPAAARPGCCTRWPHRRAGARPGRAGRPSRLGAGRGAGQRAAEPEALRHAVLAGAEGLRPGAAGVRRKREPQDRRAARARGADRAAARARAVRAHRARPRRAAAAAAAGLRPLRGRCRRLLPAARRPGRAARARGGQGLAGAGARRALGRGVRGADAAALRPAVRALVRHDYQLPPGCPQARRRC